MRSPQGKGTDRETARGSWGSASTFAPGLWRVRLKNPEGQLLVNTYVFVEDGVLAVLDPGWPWTIDLLDEALADMGLGGIPDVTHWLYTHTHVDHMGAAGLLSARSDASHLLWPAIADFSGAWHSFQDHVADWDPWVEASFAAPPQPQEDRKAPGKRSLVTRYGAARIDRPDVVAVGDYHQVGSLRLELIPAAGHDPYHIALWDPERRWLFAGDVVIAVPTPLSRAMDDDIDAYEATLDRLGDLPIDLLIPGHGVPTSGREDVARAFARSRSFVTGYRDLVRRALVGGERHSLEELASRVEPAPTEVDAKWWVHHALVDTHVRWLAAHEQARVHEGPTFSSF